MALDPSIFSMANRPTVALENPMDIAMKQMAMQQARQQLESTRMDAQAKRDAMARQAQTRQAVSTSGGDLTKAIKAAMDAGDWETADKMTMALKAQQTANATFQKTIREMDTAKREQTLKDMQEFVRIASPLTKVTDPAKFGAEAQKIAAQFDPDGSKGWGQLAQTLDPMKLKQIVDQTMDHKTWIEREFPKEQKVPLTPHAGIGPDGKPGFFQLDENGRVPAGWKPQPNMAMILQGGGSGAGGDFSKPLSDMGREAKAQAIARGEQPMLEESMRSPGNREVNNRAAAIAAASGNELKGKSEVAKVYKALSDFEGNGAANKTIRALNTMTEHVATARRLAQALESGDMPLFNRIAQTLAKETGKPAPTNFETLREFLAGEVNTVAAGGHITEAGIKSAADKLNKAQSPAQMTGALDVMDEVAAGKLVALNKDYSQITNGKTLEPKLTSATLKAFREVQKRQGGGENKPKPPKPGDVVDGYVFNGGNPADPKNWKKR